MALGAAAVRRFLDTRHVVVLATLQPDGSPLAMPMWFLHDADAVTMISVDGLAKVRNLRRDPRVCVVAESADATGNAGCGVTVQGRVEFLPDGPARRDLVDRFHTRYPGLARLWGGRTMPPDRVMFRIVPARVRSWGLSPSR
jgi:PPOX class probable F420-dependent enzyme